MDAVGLRVRKLADGRVFHKVGPAQAVLYSTELDVWLARIGELGTHLLYELYHSSINSHSSTEGLLSD